MKQIIETLKTLTHIATQMDMMLQVAKKTNEHTKIMDIAIHMEGWYSSQPYSKLLLSINLNYIMVFSCSYLDEFERHFTPANYPEKANAVLAFRRVIAPALKKIKKWKDLKDYRNELLVHNYRINDTSVFSSGHQRKMYNAPSTDSEIFLLVDLMLLINKQMIDFFKAEVEEMLQSGERIIDRYGMAGEPVNHQKDLAEITTQVEELKQKELEKGLL